MLKVAFLFCGVNGLCKGMNHKKDDQCPKKGIQCLERSVQCPEKGIQCLESGDQCPEKGI